MLKKTEIFFLVCCILSAGLFNARAGEREEAYIAKYSKIARAEMQRTGVPASITLAQGLLESGAGYSVLAVKGNNHFGIKCHSNWTGKTMRHSDDRPNECFRVYGKVEDSYKDHSDLLRYSDRYKFLFDFDPQDYESWAYGLKKAGYATDPKYPEKLIRIVKAYDLTRFDAEQKKKIEVAPPFTIEKVTVSRPASVSETFSFASSRPTFRKNGVLFVYSQQGESYCSIAQTYNLFPREILRFNDLAQEPERLLPGTVVYLARKKKVCPRGLDKYIVESETEDLREICQRFGVRMKPVMERNKFPQGYVPVRGDEILLR